MSDDIRHLPLRVDYADAMRHALETIEKLMRKYDTDEYTWNKYWEGFTDGLEKARQIVENAMNDTTCEENA